MRRRLLAALALAAAGGMLWHWTERVSAHGDDDHAPTPRPELSIPPSPDYDYAPPVLGSYQLPVIKAAADGQVLDERGEERRLHSLLDGKVTVMAFIYTRCGDICPQATMLLHELHDIAREDPTLREKLRLVTISFDPDYDTLELDFFRPLALEVFARRAYDPTVIRPGERVPLANPEIAGQRGRASA